MSKAVIGVPEAVAPGESNRPTHDEVRRQLLAILASPAFHGSKRCQQFLDHVCERALAGQESTLKERTVAIEVFGRQPESDLGEDTIVRVGAREVRKRLAQYYVSPDGALASVRIDLPPGTYVPEFRRAIIHKEPGPVPAVLAPEPPPRWWRNRVTLAITATALVAVALFAYLKTTRVTPNAEAFREFWQPAFRSSEPLLVAVAHPIVYHPSRHALKLNQEFLGPTAEGQRVIQLPQKSLDGSDFVPVLNQYVGYGDMVMVNEVTSMLARNHHAARVRFASAVEFADLRTSPTMLIGATTNRWTMEFQSKWRFQFVRNAEMRVVIEDREGGKLWSITAKEDGSSPDDYVLICRIRNSVTGGLLLVGAGLKQFGTEAAGHLLADPDQLGTILRKLPKGWETKNLQVVLHAQVIGNTPAQPEVVAMHVW